MAKQGVLQGLFDEVLQHEASDLHLGVGVPPAFRVEGDLSYLSSTRKSLSDKELWAFVGEMLTEKQIAELKEKREYDFSFTYTNSEGEEVRFRGNCFFERGNLAVALRMIPATVRTLEELDLPRELHDVATRSRGLFLVTGPTGSGKSTTLAALVQEIVTQRSCHVMTIEDPIEYLFASSQSIVHQREVGSDTMAFSEALKRVLRQDPDVIMIGEMRDLETIAAAMTAAETGHLVLATLHTPDAAQSIDRIIDVFPPYQQQQIRLQFSNILIGILSQQLIVPTGGGRKVATETLFANPAVRNSVRESKTSQLKSIMQTGMQAGMHTMDQDLARLIRDGLLTFDGAKRYSYEPKDLERLVFDMV